ncbi:MAG: NAD(P)H-binding protein [Gammaproteobacteria bacterium]|jgi:uncharacterized protein YbjT (DUF2867 family)|nr:NAD(P)H-binding protein [Gammaproteobacteria bacterium]
MTTLIIGANGQIGRLLIDELTRAGERPRAMIRDESQAAGMQVLGAEPVVADLEGDFSRAFEGVDRVVFTAGSGPRTGPDKTILVDLWGAIKAVDAAEAAGVAHFVMVSSRGAENPDKGPEKIKAYCVCKKLADDHLLASGLTHTILRPGRLTDDPAIDRVTTDWPEDAGEQWITRQDVARAVAFCLANDRTRGKVYPLFHGEQTLEEALV